MPSRIPKKSAKKPRDRKPVGGGAKRRPAGKKVAPKSAKKAPPSFKAVRLRESAELRRERAGRLLRQLQAAYPDADCALNHGSAYELLVATILSAQCTDERVNKVMPDVLRAYPDAKALADAESTELERTIRSTGFFRNKTRNLIGMAQAVCAEHDAQIPETMEELVALPGVARKTANCVLGTWFGKNVGIVVDTHVGRVAERLSLLTTARNSKDAERIERDLMELFPAEMWTWLAHALIQHGRRICKAARPLCAACPLAEDCPSAAKS